TGEGLPGRHRGFRLGRHLRVHQLRVDPGRRAAAGRRRVRGRLEHGEAERGGRAHLEHGAHVQQCRRLHRQGRQPAAAPDAGAGQDGAGQGPGQRPGEDAARVLPGARVDAGWRADRRDAGAPGVVIWQTPWTPVRLSMALDCAVGAAPAASIATGTCCALCDRCRFNPSRLAPLLQDPADPVDRVGPAAPQGTPKGPWDPDYLRSACSGHVPCRASFEDVPMKHLILGNGPAGVVAAETLRKVAPADDILMVGFEDAPPYSRMAIPYLLEGNIDESGTYLRKGVDHF